MPLFFLLSGYFFSSKDSIKTFLVKKTKSLLLPFCLFYFLSFVFQYFEGDYDSLIAYIKSFGELLAPDPPLWFLLSLYEVFIICYIVEKYFSSMILKLFITLGITILSYILIMNGILSSFIFLLQAGLGYIFFYIGHLFKIYKFFEWRRFSIYIIIGALVVYLLGIVAHVHSDIRWLVIDPSYILFFLPALGGSLLVIYFSRYIQNRRYANWLAFLGENSLLIMCIHYPLISLVYNISLPGLRYYYSLIGNSTLPTEAIEAGRICNLLTLIILVPLSLYIGLLIKKIFPFCFAKR
ncbi:acyltransferase family protein [Barnesiella viscericola]|uniref:acyltransferase family protein n=1 Tax=Barnesiella viscericola TaxID=397865 RepID=UPI0009FDFFE3|nr:acyltransferase [Barnesiella viscericola]